MLESVDEIIDALGDTGAVATALGTKPSTVSSWRVRGIPPGRWVAIAELARTLRVSGITFEKLASVHARPREPAEAVR
jgi:hypothetical protein